MIRLIVVAAFVAGLTTLSCRTFAQSTATPGAGDSPSANEKYWTPERKERAKPLMPSPKSDPRKGMRKPAPSRDGESSVAPGSPPPDKDESGAERR